MDAKEHRTVSRVTAILEAVSARGPLRVYELSAELDAPNTSVFGLVKGLVATGYLVEDQDGYRLGPAVGALLLPARPDLETATKSAMEELRDTFAETAMVGVAVGDSLLYVASAESPQRIRYSAPMQLRRPLYPPSAGKVILAHRSEKRRQRYLASLDLDASRLEAAMAELDLVRTSGVAFNRGETLPDVSAAARPILSGGEVVGALAVAGPTPRIEPRLEEIAEALVEATAEVTRRLGRDPVR